MKYGDVRSTDSVIDYLESLPQRPCGANTPTGRTNTAQSIPVAAADGPRPEA